MVPFLAYCGKSVNDDVVNILFVGFHLTFLCEGVVIECVPLVALLSYALCICDYGVKY